MGDRKLTADRCPLLRWHRWVERSEETETTVRLCCGACGHTFVVKKNKPAPRALWGNDE